MGACQISVVIGNPECPAVLDLAHTDLSVSVREATSSGTTFIRIENGRLLPARAARTAANRAAGPGEPVRDNAEVIAGERRSIAGRRIAVV